MPTSVPKTQTPMAMHPTTRVVGAGPETMVAALDAAVARVGGGAPPAVVRLTHSM